MLGRGLTRLWHQGAETFDRLNDRRLAKIQERQRAQAQAEQEENSRCASKANLRQLCGQKSGQSA